ncbi:glycerol kinase GlpK [Pseudobacteriovorax antillogorgiicola]|uniref:Glycerol kinase n=1 Tax=Pseudobacteriovorax antillogorgiicola TaxID=1513793 RepID=A0A1Y6CDG2_9BACT|nr:glycerol kinase GlpK [Pseudobacteriovorax antillogorgiicola]TCS48587.1 glycerol kinase [Pseudobacteriovorax antillogorgiicola]SMF55662.1 glycerol kinase [Pseudobacteriovorax antillogorgiicola]
MAEFILAFDQGTTSSRALLVDQKGTIAAVAQKEFKQIYPQQGWVEHDPMEIWSSQLSCAQEVMATVAAGDKVVAIGITNQRETAIVWDRQTGKPIYNAIVWQDRRTAGICDRMKDQNLEATIRESSGLVVDAYFSGTKVQWILDNVDDAREKAAAGDLVFGTVDSWLLWQLTEGRVHATDVSNACRTMLFNIKDMAWDDQLLDILKVPKSMLPEVKSNSETYGFSKLFGYEIPIAGMAGDQHAALFGQMCTEKGMVKNTYGTGCFLMMNTGPKPILSQNKLLTTIAWQRGDEVNYALEGSIFMGGAIVQWLRDELGLIKSSSEVETLAEQVTDNGGVYLVPAFVGLGAPHWDQYARGTILGMTRGSNKAHIARAALESIAYQTKDVVAAMEADAGMKLRQLRVDGGASINNNLMQFQSDILKTDVIRPQVLETTAIGAAYFAGLAIGFWKSVAEIKELWQEDRQFSPDMSDDARNHYLQKWSQAVSCAKGWAKT